MKDTNSKKYFLFLGIFLILFSLVGFYILDKANQAYTNLSREREASHLASNLWAWISESLNLRDPPEAPDNAEASPTYQNQNRPSSPGFQAMRESPKAPRRLDLDEEFTAYIKERGLKAYALLGPRNTILAYSGDLPENWKSLLEQPKDFIPLPYGDKVLYFKSQSSLFYVRALNQGPVRMRFGQGMGMAPPAGITLLLYYDGGPLVQEGFARRLLILAIALLALSALGALLYFYRHSQKLQKDLEHKEALARIGLASRNLAHEVKNPLGIIVMQKTLLQKKLGDQYKKELDRIGQEAQRILDLTNEARAGLKPQNQEGSLKETLDLACFIPQFLETVTWIPVQCGHLNSVQLSISESDLSSVLENLLHNSWEADPQARVFLQSKIYKIYRFWGPEYLSLEVWDNAGGIKKEIRDRLFEPFFSTKATGLGVGLKRSKELLEASGGRLRHSNGQLPRNFKVDPSAKSYGSCFKLEMPCFGNTKRSSKELS